VPFRGRRIVAEKCGIAIPPPKEAFPGRRKENRSGRAVEMHREASVFREATRTTAEERRRAAVSGGSRLNAEAIAQFGSVIRPAAGDALLRYLKQK